MKFILTPTSYIIMAYFVENFRPSRYNKKIEKLWLTSDTSGNITSHRDIVLLLPLPVEAVPVLPLLPVHVVPHHSSSFQGITTVRV